MLVQSFPVKYDQVLLVPPACSPPLLPPPCRSVQWAGVLVSALRTKTHRHISAADGTARHALLPYWPDIFLGGGAETVGTHQAVAVAVYRWLLDHPGGSLV